MTDAPIPESLVWVLVPTMPSADEHLQYYGDYEQSRGELARAFDALGLDWRWQPVTLDSVGAVVADVLSGPAQPAPVVLNLCDGDEHQGVPGISVIDELEAAGLAYTGADRAFYHATTSKIEMKRAFDHARVPTAPWAIVHDQLTDWHAPFQRPGRPLLVKPSVSAGSLGISVENVVDTPEQLASRVQALTRGYHGWDFTAGGLFAEEFIVGREYTTFIVGDYDDEPHRRIYPPVERVFHEALPPTEQFLSFDRLWEFYDKESPLPDGEYLWEYARVPDEASARIEAISWAAYVAVGGVGYGRVDLREDAMTGDLYVLEVNAQCGLSEDENYTSIGAILKFANASFASLIAQLLAHARRRPHTRSRRAARTVAIA